MNSNNGNGHDNGRDRVQWIEIRDSRNRLLFKYNPARNEVEVKPRDSDIYTIIRLDEIRIKHGYTPDDMRIVFVRELVATEIVTERSSEPFSNNGK